MWDGDLNSQTSDCTCASCSGSWNLNHWTTSVSTCSVSCVQQGLSVHGISQARILEWIVIFPPEISPTTESNLGLLHLLRWQANSLPLSHLGSPLDQ